VSVEDLPAATCTVAGCGEPAVVSHRAPTTAEVVDAPAGELVPLCTRHAEQANAPEVP
jgi:hypothetical protein